MTTNLVNILLVDDDQIDVQGVKRSFSKAKIANPIHVARDGIEALEMLRGENGHEQLSRSHIILLDLNMPRMTGIVFLDEIRKDKELHASVVFVLTAPSDEEDTFRAYKHHIEGYIVTPESGKDFLSALSMLDHYWRVVDFREGLLTAVILDKSSQSGFSIASGDNPEVRLQILAQPSRANF